MIKVFIDEEYGYRYWIWTYPGTAEELIEDWKKGNAPLNFFDPSVGNYKGTMFELGAMKDVLEEMDKAEIKAHIHEDWDTVLTVCDKGYRPNFWNIEEMALAVGICPKMLLSGIS
jgi:hypothetical protein